MHSMNLTDSPLSRLCLSKGETIHHILLDCEEIEYLRARFLGLGLGMGTPCSPEILETIGLSR